MSDEVMSSSRPYLVRAMYDWVVDNGLTPYVLVDALYDGVAVPEQYIKDGRIVLNVSPKAIHGYHQDNNWILFNGRFSGQPMDVNIPIPAVLAIYAKENGQGMMFDPDEEQSTVAPGVDASSQKQVGKKQAKKPQLELVK